MHEPSKLQSVVESAGLIALSYYRKVKPHQKENQTYVTKADLEVQKHIRTYLEKEFPHYGIIAEENNLTKKPTSGNNYWVIDPIDGTASFVRGFPTWGIAIGQINASKVVGGLYFMPAMGDLYYTEGKDVRVNNASIKDMPQANAQTEKLLLVGSKFHNSFVVDETYPGKIRSLGSVTAHLCYVAAGSADAALIPRVGIWDLVVGLGMIESAGGIIEYFDGEKLSLDDLINTHKTKKAIICGKENAVNYFRSMLKPISQ